MNWQSRSCPPDRRINPTSHESATLLALFARLNIDSPQKTEPNPTP
jgi:hypothetical protein